MENILYDTHYEFKKLVRTSCCGTDCTWRPSDIFVTFQEAAGEHLHVQGVTRSTLLENNIFWAIVMAKVEIYSMPKAYENLTVKTWASKPRLAFAPRTCECYGEDNSLKVKSLSYWSMVDFKERKLISLVPKFNPHTISDDPQFSAPKETLKNIRIDLKADKSITRICSYSDLDPNRHMNNARYVDWICDFFDYTRFDDNYISSLQINYKSQLAPNECMTLSIKEQGDDFYVWGEKGDGISVIAAQGKWSKK